MRVLRSASTLALNTACLCTWLLVAVVHVRAQDVPQQVVVDPVLVEPATPVPVVAVDPAAPTPAPTVETPSAAPVSTAEPVAATDAPAAPVAVEIPAPPAAYGASAVASAPGPAPVSAENPMRVPDRTPSTLPEPGTHEHDGFFFRATLGFGGASATGDYGGTSLDVKGGGVLISLAFGKVVREDLALYGELQAMSVSEPDVSVDDEDLDNVRDAGFSSIGLGGSYYFMPLNAFVGGTLGLGMATVNRKAMGSTSTGDEPSGATGTGMSLGVHAGKEWWVSDNWGIGVAAYGTYLSLPDGRDSTLSVIYLGLGASATYN